MFQFVEAAVAVAGTGRDWDYYLRRDSPIYRYKKSRNPLNLIYEILLILYTKSPYKYLRDVIEK
jgi:hypothetical protein